MQDIFDSTLLFYYSAIHVHVYTIIHNCNLYYIHVHAHIHTNKQHFHNVMVRVCSFVIATPDHLKLLK